MSQPSSTGAVSGSSSDADLRPRTATDLDDRQIHSHEQPELLLPSSKRQRMEPPVASADVLPMSELDDPHEVNGQNASISPPNAVLNLPSPEPNRAITWPLLGTLQAAPCFEWLHDSFLSRPDRSEQISLGIATGMAILTQEIVDPHLSTPWLRSALGFLPVAAASGLRFIGQRQKMGTWPLQKGQVKKEFSV